MHSNDPTTAARGASLTSEPLLRVARVHPRTTAEGPGTRFAVWVQGCSIRCDGCFNPHLWTDAGGTAVSAVDLAKDAISAGVEGVTLLGGEPFEQAEALAKFASLVRSDGLSVMAFTGYLLDGLRARAVHDGSIRDLIKATDLLIDGPYLAGQPDLKRPWVGSTNQQFHFLTERYVHLQADLAALHDRLEVRVDTNGAVSLNGWATVDQLDALLAPHIESPKRGRVR